MSDSIRKYEWFRPLSPGHPRDSNKPNIVHVFGGADSKPPLSVYENPRNHAERCHNIATWLIWAGMATTFAVYRVIGREEIRAQKAAQRLSKLKIRGPL